MGYKEDLAEWKREEAEKPLSDEERERAELAYWAKVDQEEDMLTHILQRTISLNLIIIKKQGSYYITGLFDDLIMDIGHGFNNAHKFIGKAKTRPEIIKFERVFPKYISLFW